MINKIFINICVIECMFLLILYAFMVILYAKKHAIVA